MDRCTLVNLGLDFVNELVIADRNENFTANTTFDPDCEPELYDNPNFDDIEFSIQNNFDQCGAEIEVGQIISSQKYTILKQWRSKNFKRGVGGHRLQSHQKSLAYFIYLATCVAQCPPPPS